MLGPLASQVTLASAAQVPSALASTVQVPMQLTAALPGSTSQFAAAWHSAVAVALKLASTSHLAGCASILRVTWPSISAFSAAPILPFASSSASVMPNEA